MHSTVPYGEPTDLRFKRNCMEPCTQIVDNKGSISNLIATNPNLSIFCNILKKSNMYVLYNDPLANFTIFVPTNDSISCLNLDTIDLAESISIVKASSFNRKVNNDLLKMDIESMFNTRDDNNRLLVTNVGNKIMINETINIVGDEIVATNGIIHIIDNIIIPTVFI